MRNACGVFIFAYNGPRTKTQSKPAFYRKPTPGLHGWFLCQARQAWSWETVFGCALVSVKGEEPIDAERCAVGEGDVFQDFSGRGGDEV